MDSPAIPRSVCEEIADQLVELRLERPEDHAASPLVARDLYGRAQIAAQVVVGAFGARAGWEAQLADQDRLVELQRRQLVDRAALVGGEALPIIPVRGVAPAVVG